MAHWLISTIICRGLTAAWKERLMFLCFFFPPQPSLCSVHYCLDFCSICQISCSLKPFPAFEVWGSLQGPSSSTHSQMVFRPKSQSVHKLFSFQQHVSVTNSVQPGKRKVKIAVNAEETYGRGHNLHMKQ